MYTTRVLGIPATVERGYGRLVYVTLLFSKGSFLVVLQPEWDEEQVFDHICDKVMDHADPEVISAWDTAKFLYHALTGKL